MKKFICIMMAAVLCLFCVACTGKQNDETKPAGYNTTATPSGDSTTGEADVTTAEAGDVTTAEEVTSEESTAAAEVPTVPEADAVASIGSKFYGSLDDALTAVKDGETINITKDFTQEDTLVTYNEGKYTINGNGHTITANIVVDAFLKVEYAEVDVINLKVIHEDALHGVQNGQLGVCAFNADNDGIITLTDVEVLAKYGDGLNISHNGIMNIISGKFEIDAANDAQQSNLICLNDTGTLNVKDGTFKRNGTTSTKRALIRMNGSGQTLNIEGGAWEASCGRLIYTNGGSAADQMRNITLSGCTVTLGVDDPASYSYDPFFQVGTGGGLNLTIKGGTYEVKGNCPMTFFNCSKKNINVVIEDGTFINGAGEFFISNAAAEGTDTASNITVKGGTFTNTAGSFLSASNIEGGVVIEGGTFNTKNAEEANALKALAGSSAAVIN